jgi:hypothetical protein
MAPTKGERTDVSTHQQSAPDETGPAQATTRAREHRSGSIDPDKPDAGPDDW